MFSGAQALQKAQIDEQIDQGVLVGDGGAIAQVRALDAEMNGERIDALDGGALFVNIGVERAVAIKGVTKASAGAGGHHGSATAVRPAFVIDRTSGGRF